MINKIKDKQTGEYHDIGGLKCKLVAEGTLPTYDENNNCYNMPYELEMGKAYMITINVYYFDLNFYLFKTNEETSCSTSCPSPEEDIMLHLRYFEKSLAIFNSSMETLGYYDDAPYKIYELPFALEV